ncbi:MAG: hypothetical protein ACLTMP_00555 [Eggerthella lenta]
MTRGKSTKLNLIAQYYRRARSVHRRRGHRGLRAGKRGGVSVVDQNVFLFDDW